MVQQIHCVTSEDIKQGQVEGQVVGQRQQKSYARVVTGNGVNQKVKPKKNVIVIESSDE